MINLFSLFVMVWLMIQHTHALPISACNLPVAFERLFSKWTLHKNSDSFTTLHQFIMLHQINFILFFFFNRQAEKKDPTFYIASD